jgi:hypothetical protein
VRALSRDCWWADVDKPSDYSWSKSFQSSSWQAMYEQSTLPSYVISNRARRLLFVLPHDHNPKTQGLPCDGISPDCCAHIFGTLKTEPPLYLAPPYASPLIGNTRAGYRAGNMIWQVGGIVCRSLKPGPVTVIFLSWPWSWASCDSTSYEKRWKDIDRIPRGFWDDLIRGCWG